MNTRDGFNARKEAFATAITELSEFFVRRGQQDLLVRARDLRDKLVAEQFNLVVLGQFKRGKSTLINALLSADLLPTAVVPLTSIVTIIHYGPAPRALVSFLDGRELEVDVADIASFITESQNPRNIKRVAQVTVAFPSDVLKEGVRLVDTPGVGSVFAGNTGTTMDYLPQADAAIFLLAADQPISQAELEFLQTVRPHAAKFFFVLQYLRHLVGYGSSRGSATKPTGCSARSTRGLPKVSTRPMCKRPERYWRSCPEVRPLGARHG
jgi:GTPase SAR1 family protein